MFNWLKRFCKWPDQGINNLSELGQYVKKNWWGLLLALLLVAIAVWLITKLSKILLRLVLIVALVLVTFCLVVWLIKRP